LVPLNQQPRYGKKVSSLPLSWSILIVQAY
jgi:hypothetical protein